MKRELIKFRKWWNENKSKLSIKITIRDIDDYLSTLSDKKEDKLDIYYCNCSGKITGKHDEFCKIKNRIYL